MLVWPLKSDSVPIEKSDVPSEGSEKLVESGPKDSVPAPVDQSTEEINPEVVEFETSTELLPSEQDQSENNLVKACDHPRYTQFFKMLKFGVSAEAVRHKMVLSEQDPKILDTPDAMIKADGD